MIEPMSDARRAEIEALVAEHLKMKDALRPAYLLDELTKCRLAIIDLLAELRRREWQPIATAPKDGTWIIAWPCYHSKRCWQIRWRDEKRHPGWEDHMGSVPVQPTHWQPMPEPPAGPSEPFLDTRTVEEARNQKIGEP